MEYISQGTPAESAILKLFVGKMKTFIKCVNVNYEESGIREFNGEKQHSSLRNTEPWVNSLIQSIVQISN